MLICMFYCSQEMRNIITLTSLSSYPIIIAYMKQSSSSDTLKADYIEHTNYALLINRNVLEHLKWFVQLYPISFSLGIAAIERAWEIVLSYSNLAPFIYWTYCTTMSSCFSIQIKEMVEFTKVSHLDRRWLDTCQIRRLWSYLARPCLSGSTQKCWLGR